MAKKSKYKLLANAVMVIHILWIVFMILSIPLVLILPSSGLLVLLSAAIMIALSLTYGTCIVTDLEKKLISKYDPSKLYSGSFITHYLEKFFKIKARDREINAISYVLASGLFFCVTIQHLL